MDQSLAQVTRSMFDRFSTADHEAGAGSKVEGGSTHAGAKLAPDQFKPDGAFTELGNAMSAIQIIGFGTDGPIIADLLAQGVVF